MRDRHVTIQEIAEEVGISIFRLIPLWPKILQREGRRNSCCNEKSMRALHTTSLRYCLPATNAIDLREKIHTCA